MILYWPNTSFDGIVEEITGLSCAELNFEVAEHSESMWKHSSLCCCLNVVHLGIPQVAWLTVQFSLLEQFTGMEGDCGLSCLGPYPSEEPVTPFWCPLVQFPLLEHTLV